MTNIKATELIPRRKAALLVLTMLFGVLYIGITTASASTVNLRSVKVPRGRSVNSQTFRVRNRGMISAVVRVRTNTLFGVSGQSRYRVQLKRGTRVLVSRTILVSSRYRDLRIQRRLANCNDAGTYHFRITNVTRDNPQEGIVAFRPFDAPDLTPRTVNLSQFGVTQGNTINRPIPRNGQPRTSTGRMKITATWDGICLPNPKGCSLRFTLRRNGRAIRTDTGYSHSSVFAGSTEKMTINHVVQPNQIGGTWDLRIRGSSHATVANVRTRASFTPVCRN